MIHQQLAQSRFQASISQAQFLFAMFGSACTNRVSNRCLDTQLCPYREHQVLKHSDNRHQQEIFALDQNQEGPRSIHFLQLPFRSCAVLHAQRQGRHESQGHQSMGLALFYNIYLFYIKFFLLVLFSFFWLCKGHQFLTLRSKYRLLRCSLKNQGAFSNFLDSVCQCFDVRFGLQGYKLGFSTAYDVLWIQKEKKHPQVAFKLSVSFSFLVQ